MKIQRSVLDDGVAALTLTGEFDSFAANPFLEQAEAIIQSGVSNVVANLRLVLFINSTAIGSLIKARKRFRGLGGDLVVAEPSSRVKETFSSLGLDKVLRSFATDEEAHQFLAESDNEAVDVPSENAVLLKFVDSAKQERFSQVGRVAKMAALEENGIKFFSPGDTDLFSQGTELKVKFRLPLFRRAYYFDVPCKVRAAQAADEGVRVECDFGEIYPEDRRSISQFVRDMRLLKDEIQQAN